MEQQELIEKIIGCAYKVYNTIGSGFFESVYENSLMIALSQVGLKAQAQQPISVWYSGQIVGEFFADIVVEDLIILELKAVRQIATIHEVQLVNYLKATNKDFGLLINFGEKRVDIKRKYRNYKPRR